MSFADWTGAGIQRVLSHTGAFFLFRDDQNLTGAIDEAVIRIIEG